MTGQSAESPSVSVAVLFFAGARERTNEKSISISVPLSTTPWEAFKNYILPRYPSLAPLSEHCVLALNQTYVTPEGKQGPLREGDELAVIPPISGG